MKTILTQLPEAELDLMQCLWEAGCPVERKYCCEALWPAHRWAPTTVLTMLSRLTKKGYVKAEKDGGRSLYSAAVSRGEYLGYVNGSFLHRLYKGSFGNMVAAMADSGEVSSKDIEELETLIRRLKEEGKP